MPKRQRWPASRATDGGRAGSDLIIEAATENLPLKLKLFGELSELAGNDAIVAINTSSISITKLAAATRIPDRVIGMHFFNPIPMMQLIELIRGLQTVRGDLRRRRSGRPQARQDAGQDPQQPRLRREPAALPVMNEAINALAEGLASAEEIDTAMKLGANHPMGPLALCDLVGLDVELAVMNVLYEGFKDPKYRPAPLLVEMVEAGYLGRKSGRGFYTYK